LAIAAAAIRRDICIEGWQLAVFVGCVWMARSAETNNASGWSSSRRQRSAAAAAAV